MNLLEMAEAQTRETPLVSTYMVRDAILKTTPSIGKAHDAWLTLRTLIGDRDREYVCVISLDTKNVPIHFNIVTIGTLNEAHFGAREVFKTALMASAAGILLAHNHPSGHLEPSHCDRAITKRMQQAAELLGLRFVDHLIVTPDGFWSFTEQKEWRQK